MTPSYTTRPPDPPSDPDGEGSSGGDRPRRRHRVPRLLLGMALGIVGLLVAVLVAIQRPSVATWLVNAVLSRTSVVPRAVMSVREARGDWLTGFELRGLRLVRRDTLIAGVDTLRARYRITSLFLGRLEVRSLHLAGVLVTTDLADTTRPAVEKPPLRFADLLRGRFYAGPPVHIDRFTVSDARYGGRPAAPDSGLLLTRIELQARDLRLGGAFSFRIDTLQARIQPAHAPSHTVEASLAASLNEGRLELRSLTARAEASDIRARGLVALDDRDSVAAVELVLRAQPFSLADLASFAPGLPLAGVATIAVDLHGSRPERLSGTASFAVEGARVGPVELGPSRVDLALADGRAETRLIATYERAQVAAVGWTRPFDRTPTYDIEARAGRLPASLPGATWWPPLAARADASVALRLRGSGYARPAIDVTGRAEGALGRVDLDARLDLTQGVSWTVRRLTFAELDVARVVGDTSASSINGSLTAEGQGVDAASRRMTAALHVDPSRYGAWRIQGADARAGLEGDHLGVALRVETSAGTLEVDSLRVGWDPPGRFRMVGTRFRGLDLAGVTGQQALASRLDGSVRIEGRGLSALASAGARRTRAARNARGSPLAALRDGRLSARFRVELAPSGFRDVPISHGLAEGSLSGGAVDLDVDLRSADGQLELVVAGRPFDPTPTFQVRRGRFTDLDLAGWTGTPALRSRLAGSMTGGTRSGGDPLAHDASLAVRIDPSPIGPIVLDGGEVRALWSQGRVRLDAALRTARDTVRAGGEASFGDSHPHGRLEASLPLAVIAALAGRDSLATTGRLDGHVTWSGDPEAPATVAGTVTGRGSIDLARLDSLLVRARLQRGTLILDTLAVLSNVAVAAGSGRIALADSGSALPTDLGIALTLQDASPLKALFGADTLAVGSGFVQARLRGTGAARTYDVGGNLRSLAWNDVRVLRVDGSARGDLDGAWHPTRVDLDASLSRLQAFDVAVEGVAARASYRPGQAWFGLASRFDARHGCRVAGGARVDSLGFHVTLDTLDVRADSAAWTLAQPARCDIGTDRLAVSDFHVASARGHIQAHGVIDRRGDQSFRLDAEGVGLDALLAWLGRGDAHGTLATRLTLEGPATAPRGSGSFQVDLASAGHPAGSLRSEMAWNGTRLDLGGRFATAEADSLTWAGHLPLSFSLAPVDTASAAGRVRLLEGEVDMRVEANRFPLRAFSTFLDPKSVGDLGGTLDIDARLKGNSRTLVGSGTIEVADGVLPLPGLGVTYRDLVLSAAFQDDSLLVRRAHAASAKGTIDAAGRLRFVSVARVEPLLHVAARRFALAQTSDLKVTTSADLDLSGTLSQPVIRGKVSVANTNFTFKQSDLAAGGSTTAVQLSDADVRMMEETFGYVKAPGPNMGLALYEASDLDLGITLEGNCWLHQRVQPQLSVALTGQFQLRKAPHGEPELFGRIEPVPGRGYVEQFARNFDIVGGEVVLNGKPKDHTVNIQAQYKPPSSSETDDSEVAVHLAVEGTADHLRLTLSSEPAMSDAEIVNFIATGRSRVDPSTSGAQGSSLAKDIGLSQVSGVATSAAQEATGLDVLQVRFDALQGATLVSGNYLNPKLYVGIRQPLQYKDSSSPTATETYRTRYEVEYTIYRWLVLNLQGETSKLRSFFRARYAY